MGVNTKNQLSQAAHMALETALSLEEKPKAFPDKALSGLRTPHLEGSIEFTSVSEQNRVTVIVQHENTSTETSALVDETTITMMGAHPENAGG